MQYENESTGPSQKDLARVILKENEPHVQIQPALEAFLGVGNPFVAGEGLTSENKQILREASKRKLQLLLILLANGGHINQEGDKDGIIDSFLHGVPFEETGLGTYALKVNLTGLDHLAKESFHTALTNVSNNESVYSFFTPKANIETLPDHEGPILDGRAKILSATSYSLTQITSEKDPFTSPYLTAHIEIEPKNPIVVIPPFLTIRGASYNTHVTVEQQRAGSFERPDLRFKEVTLSLMRTTLFPKV